MTRTGRSMVMIVATGSACAALALSALAGSAGAVPTDGSGGPITIDPPEGGGSHVGAKVHRDAIPPSTHPSSKNMSRGSSTPSRSTSSSGRQPSSSSSSSSSSGTSSAQGATSGDYNLYVTSDGRTTRRQPGPMGGPVAIFDVSDGPASTMPSAPDQPAPAAPEAPQPAAPQVDPGQLAIEASTQLRLAPPEIGSTPNDANTPGAVGLPVWFWVSNPGTATTGPASTSATAGDVTVDLQATFTGLTIQTGDGNSVECAGPGTPYPGSGVQPSPDCGYVYQRVSEGQDGGVYQVGAVAHWTVTWTSNIGQSGTLTMDLDTSKQLRISSYQAVGTGR